MQENLDTVLDTLIVTFTDYGLQVVGAVVILIVGWVVAGWARRSVSRMVDRVPRMDATLKPLFGGLVRYTVLTFVFIGVLSQFGVQTTSIIAVLGAAGLAIGFALQGTLSNVASGVMLLTLRPLRVGEYVDAGGLGGTVKEIGLFTTELTTADGVFVTAPNSQLWNSTITNYSRNPTRRMNVVIGIGYGDDIEAASRALMDLMQGDERVLADPAPQVLVTQLADSSVNLTMRLWSHIDDFWQLQFDLNKQAKLAVEAAGCTIPFPQREVHVIQETQPTAVAKVPEVS